MNLKEAEVIEASLPGWQVTSYKSSGEILLKRGTEYRLRRYNDGTWVCSVDSDHISCSSAACHTPGDAIGLIQQRIIKRLAGTGQLLGTLTGIKL